MKTKLTLEQFEVFANLTWNDIYFNAIIEQCSKCGSTSIKILESSTVGNHYQAIYKCLDCSATASINEYWQSAESVQVPEKKFKSKDGCTMGLDITAYEGLTEVENAQLDEYGEPVNYETEWTGGAGMLWSEKHFEGRGEGVDPNKVYNWSDYFDFRAGSYSSYGEWRRLLDEFKGDVAFQELINFADNEGVIGSVVSKKLANDFKKHKEDAKIFAETLGEDYGDYWLEKYYDWLLAFEYASKNGAVCFH